MFFYTICLHETLVNVYIAGFTSFSLSFNFLYALRCYITQDDNHPPTWLHDDLKIKD